VSALATRIFRGTHPVDALDPGDRGLAYGDGLFETMRVHARRVAWLDAHLARLGQDAARLRIDQPADDWLRERIAELVAGAPRDAVLKLVLTRGTGGRGYAPARDLQPTLLLALHPIPPPLPAALVVRWCATRVAIQPALAGIKHLNRLEQVLARAESTTSSIHEGLMLDTADEVVGATAANLFVRAFGEWITPPVDRRGIAGIARGWVLANEPARIATLTRTMVEEADAVFLCNAVRGILPVTRLGERRWDPHPAVDAMRRRLGRQEPAFAPGS
jgi:4-amino-4-deoxychorismate lyase